MFTVLIGGGVGLWIQKMVKKVVILPVQHPASDFHSTLCRLWLSNKISSEACQWPLFSPAIMWPIIVIYLFLYNAVGVSYASVVLNYVCDRLKLANAYNWWLVLAVESTSVTSLLCGSLLNVQYLRHLLISRHIIWYRLVTRSSRWACDYNITV